jgi:rhodanese-related sulfurtransferase
MSRATRRNPQNEWNYFLLAAAYGHLGRAQKAKDAMVKFNETYHDPTDRQRPFTLADINNQFFNVAANRKRLLEGLRKAGVPAGESPAPADTKYKELVKVTEGAFDVEGAIKIDAVEAKTLHDRGVTFIDSRGSSLFKRGHIPGAKNLLFHQVWDSLSRYVAANDEVVFYCDDKNCHLAALSSAQALILGHTKVYYFAEGLKSWSIAGYPLEAP